MIIATVIAWTIKTLGGVYNTIVGAIKIFAGVIVDVIEAIVEMID